MKEIYDRKPVPDPQICCMAIGDANCDGAPLQVTQFEASIVLAEQMKNIFIEGGGGGNGGESYPLAWLFAGYKTKCDRIRKRHQKGYIFTVGDESPHLLLQRGHINRFIGLNAESDMRAPELLKHVQQDWHIFHFIVNPVPTQDVIGKRHVFQHFGSGTFANAVTYLSRFFVVNPLLWKKEADVLRSLLGYIPRMYIDSRAVLTIPYDMLINQFVEKWRRDGKHGSCGVGIHEATTRCWGPFDWGRRGIPLYGAPAQHGTFCIDTITSLNLKMDLLGRAAAARYERLTGTRPPDELIDLLRSESLYRQFLDAHNEMLCHTTIIRGLPEYPLTAGVVFEGAQGLLLDELGDFRPFVTSSSTGLRNVIAICRESDISRLTVNYVLRTYLTRHGPGPFPSEDEGLRYADDTNSPNAWQGNLRFGRMDARLIGMGIRRDLETDTVDVAINPQVVLTHCDQQDFNPVWENDLRLPIAMTSWGPSRSDVNFFGDRL